MVVGSGCLGDGQGRRLKDGGHWVIPLACAVCERDAQPGPEDRRLASCGGQGVLL